MTGILRFGRILWISVCCVVYVGSSLTRPAGAWPLDRLLQRTGQSKPAGKTLDDTLKWLGTIIEGNSAQTVSRAARYDSYNYESFRSEGCFVGWRETHESFKAQTRLSKTVEDLSIALSGLSRSSVRVDKVGESVYVVSFTTLKLKMAIASRVKSTRQDGSEDTYTSAQSGYGVYFQNGPVAHQVARALVFSIRSCQREELP